MKILFSVIAIVLLTACQKENNFADPIVSRAYFFKNEAEAFREVQSVISQRSPGEKLARIQSISYIESKNKQYAFVFYESDKGTRNIVFEKQYSNGQSISTNSITCGGGACDCKVTTVISNSGDVTVGCSCSSCTMAVNTITPSAS